MNFKKLSLVLLLGLAGSVIAMDPQAEGEILDKNQVAALCRMMTAKMQEHGWDVPDDAEDFTPEAIERLIQQPTNPALRQERSNRIAFKLLQSKDPKKQARGMQMLTTNAYSKDIASPTAAEQLIAYKFGTTPNEELRHEDYLEKTKLLRAQANNPNGCPETRARALAELQKLTAQRGNLSAALALHDVGLDFKFGDKCRQEAQPVSKQDIKAAKKAAEQAAKKAAQEAKKAKKK